MNLTPPRIYVESHGCSENFADGEMLAGALTKAGYRLAPTPHEADVLIYNTCAVKGVTENRMLSLINRAPAGKKVIVTGCLPLINPRRLKREARFHAALGAAPGDAIAEAVERVIRGETFFEARNDHKPSLGLLRLAPLVEVRKTIPIAYGCTSSCSFCAVPLSRGRLRSYSVEEVKRQIEYYVGLGVKEFWLTATDTACYGWDVRTNLVELLNAINRVEGKFLVRLGMMNPSYLPKLLNGLGEALKGEKLFKFLHLPLQSGSDHVLKLMRRGYSAEQFIRMAEALRGKVPHLTLATDIICGFPGEDHEAFEDTLTLIRRLEPDVVNVSKFHPRPGTAASRMRQIPTQTVKERSKKVAELARSIALERNRAWIGWTGEVLVDEKGKGDTWVGRNFAYKPVVLRGEGDLYGKFMRVKVTGASPTHLEGEIL